MIIVDTSVAIKWLSKNEVDRENALLLFQNHLKKTIKIAVPPLFYIEAANALATKGILGDSEIIEGLNFLYDSSLFILTESREDIKEAALMAKRYKTSVYDMIYAVLAKKNESTLITADEKFIKRVNFPFVKALSSIH